ncbi:MAG: ribose-phosphate pyrophosphokinase [Oscillospiraceae bacterium]|nr:ribose-phosphate pyrophosphokinase [Oscillospiraceae bacterium]
MPSTFTAAPDDKIPYAPIGIISLESSRELGNSVDSYLVQQRRHNVENGNVPLHFPAYLRDSYLIDHATPRFASGEGKAILKETVRGYDIYIIADISNYSCTYKMYNMECRMSPDDIFQDIKRVIAAIGGKAKRINVIMPLLYESRQHRKAARESLDCAMALQELEHLGVANIFTFDAHDARVQNAIPFIGFENVTPTYQIIKALLKNVPDIEIDKEKLVVVSPDEGGMSRSLYFASMLGVNVGMFYKRRDYTKIVNGRNPIISHEFLGDSVEGKDVLIIDDMISSGESVIDIAYELKKRGAKRIFVGVTFGLFTEGTKSFDKAYEEGAISKVFSTNLNYRPQEVIDAPWYAEADMSKFLSLIIDTMNHDSSISSLLSPIDKINKVLAKHKAEIENK